MEGIFLVNGFYVRFLFGLWCYIFLYFLRLYDRSSLVMESVLAPFEIFILIRRSTVLNTYYCGVYVRMDRLNFMVDLVVMSMSDYDVIIGIDWLGDHHVSLDCFSKMVTF